MRNRNQKKVSIIIPTFNEEQYIGTVLENIISQTYSFDSIEVIVADGRSTDKTREIIKVYTKKYSNVILVDNPEGIVPYALNYALERVSGDVVLRLDAHSVYPDNYVEILVEKLDSTGADNVGGVWDVVPANDTLIARAIALSNSSRFGIGSPAYRFKDASEQEVDTMPFGCYRRDVFDRIGNFDTDLVRNQDDEFNSRLIKNGGKIFVIPKVRVKYVARSSLLKMAKMFYQYGLYKPLASKKLGGVSTIRQLVPPIFLLVILLLISLSVYDVRFGIALLIFMFVYFFVALSESLKFYKSIKDVPLLVVLPLVFFIIHVSYGAGYLRGVLNTFVFGFNYKHDRVTVSR